MNFCSASESTAIEFFTNENTAQSAQSAFNRVEVKAGHSSEHESRGVKRSHSNSSSNDEELASSSQIETKMTKNSHQNDPEAEAEKTENENRNWFTWLCYENLGNFEDFTELTAEEEILESFSNVEEQDNRVVEAEEPPTVEETLFDENDSVDEETLTGDESDDHSLEFVDYDLLEGVILRNIGYSPENKENMPPSY